ncbi:MAG TPA: MurR/RpiR family transcriptional regulator [Clostridiaceae bacterium]|jgi:RpiR family carbohydrate utilization transcriptional regulator|nr:MurR/RpiR family transcriptional regulator [Clostridiaceae bacterium]
MEKNSLLIMRSLYPSMHESERKIADFIMKQPELAVNMTVAQLSGKAGVADSSIIRFCRKLGFNGFTELKINIAKNLKKPEELILENISREDSYPAIASKVFALSIQALEDSLKVLDPNELSKAVELLLNARRIEFYGVGTSATLAMDAYYRFMRIGLNTYAATDPHICRISASKLDSGCVAVGISHTGRTRDTVRAIEIAKEREAKTICITSYLESPIAKLADSLLLTSTSEARFMKEAVSARIAQIALLDSLYTCVAVRRYDSVVENIEQMTEILNETRL